MRVYIPAPLKSLIKIIFSPKYYLLIFFNDLRSLFGNKFGNVKIIFVAGYPKSGTTWVENFISNIPGYSPRILNGSRDMIRHHHLPKDAFNKIPNYGYSAIKTHILPYSKNIDVLIQAGINKVVVMYRDPRDIAISQYYHVLKENPWLASDQFYEDYTKMNKSSAIQHSIDMVLFDYDSWVKGWLSVEKNNSDIDCMVIKYEDLRLNSTQIFKKLLFFYGIELEDNLFNKMFISSDKKISTNFIDTFTSLNPGTKSTKRKGQEGEWKMEMNSEHKKYFKDKAGDLLIELGYEDDYDW